ncbi:MAG: hypothetical protein QM537_01215 [Candidatus Symbiobacter sp.]|nr:hypothetical protein [Candidatus Symbiobacter sp.]
MGKHTITPNGSISDNVKPSKVKTVSFLQYIDKKRPKWAEWATIINGFIAISFAIISTCSFIFRLDTWFSVTIWAGIICTASLVYLAILGLLASLRNHKRDNNQPEDDMKSYNYLHPYIILAVIFMLFLIICISSFLMHKHIATLKTPT